MEFEHDIFLSYAHEDNNPDRHDKGWVELFHGQLLAQLAKVNGKRVSVWRDRELKRGEKFDPVIEKAVRGSGLMISLITKTYLERDYCKQEIDWFCDEARKGSPGLVVNDVPRVLPVLLYNVPFDSWPDVCRGTSGYAFHDIADPHDPSIGRPLDPNSDTYWDRLRVLVDEVVDYLNRLHEQETPGTPHTGNGVRPFRVFLAQAADDMVRDRRFLKRELEAQGVDIISVAPAPGEELIFGEQVAEAVKTADLSVHVFGRLPGRPVDEDGDDLETTAPLVEARVAAEHAPLQLVLLSREFRLDDIEEESETYRAFMREMLEGPRTDDRLEVVQTGWQRMAEEILTRRKRIAEQAQREAEQATGAPGTAFIDLHESDVPRAAELVSYLAQHNIAPVMVPSADRTPDCMERFEEHLRTSQTCIVVYGAVAGDWVKERAKEAAKVVLGNDLPTRVAVYVAPPEKDPAELVFPGIINVMDNMRGFDPDPIATLLDRNGGGR
jgi:hypothetical protein